MSRSSSIARRNRFVVEDGELKGMMFEHLEYDIQDGDIKATRVVGEEFFPCDDVILAIGQENAFPWIETRVGIEFDKWNVPKVDKVTFQSTLPERVFRRRRGVRAEEHHLVGRTRPSSRHFDPQILPATKPSPSACRAA